MQTKTVKKLLSLLLVAIMTLGLMPTLAIAADSLAITDGGGGQIQGYISKDGFSTEYIINTADTIVTVTGNATNSRIIIKATGVIITLNNVTMKLYECNGSPIEIAEGCSATIILEGENTLSAYAGGPGILVNQGATLTIKESNNAGSLTVKSGTLKDYTSGETAGGQVYGFAGIGGPNNYEDDPLAYTGTINILSGNITAIGYGYGAGIGGGKNSSGGTINISGGTVTAKLDGDEPSSWNGDSFQNASGIGGSQGQYSGEITISGDATTVIANGGYDSPGIGGGYSDVTIKDSAEVTATGGSYAAGIGGYSRDKGSSTITISDNARVTAYGGKNASGLGEGSIESTVSLSIENTAFVTAYSDGTKAAITGTPKDGTSKIINFYMQDVTLPPMNIPLTVTNTENLSETSDFELPSGYKALGTNRVGNNVVSGSYNAIVDLSVYSAGTYIIVPYRDESPAFDFETNADSVYSGVKAMLIQIYDGGKTVQLNPTWGVKISSNNNVALVFDGDNGTIIVPNGGEVTQANATEAITWPLGGTVSKSGELSPNMSDITFTKNLNAQEIITLGSDLTLSVELEEPTDGIALSYQWYKDEVAIVGETGTSLVLSNIQSEDIGKYHVLVSKTLSGVTTSLSSVVCNVTLQSTSGSSGGDYISYYTLSFNTNGGTSIDALRRASGTRIDISQYKPTREGYTFDGWYSDADLTTQISSVTLSSNTTVYAKWTADAAEKKTVTHEPYISGYTDGTFRPDSSISKAEVAQLLYNISGANASGTNQFSDVASGAWYDNAVTTLASKGVISGYTDGTFRPDSQITRVEFVALVVRYAGLSEVSGSSFSDVSSDSWAAGYISAAAQAGFINGYTDGTFRPDSSITRAEAVTILNAMLGREIEASTLSELSMPFSDVPTNHWAYEQILEAAVAHEHE